MKIVNLLLTSGLFALVCFLFLFAFASSLDVTDKGNLNRVAKIAGWYTFVATIIFILIRSLSR